MNWLHFVGRSYYDIEQYIKEAEKLGASRRVSQALLPSFTWGDRIWLAQGEGAKRTEGKQTPPAVVFGYFTFDQVGGLLPGEADHLTTSDNMLFEPYLEERGCGQVYVNAVYLCGVSVDHIAAYMKATESQAKLLLRGPFTAVYPELLLTDIHHFQGYRQVDGDLFAKNVKLGDHMGVDRVVVPGECRPLEKNTVETVKASTTLMEVSGYTLAVPKKALSQVIQDIKKEV